MVRSISQSGEPNTRRWRNVLLIIGHVERWLFSLFVLSSVSILPLSYSTSSRILFHLLSFLSFLSFLVFLKDTGVGISSKDKAHLFEPYRQLRHGKAQGMGGAGLGLALVKLLVGLHGGDVNVYSREGVGSRFFLTIRFDTIADDSLALQFGHSLAGNSELKGKGKYCGRMLIVDDMAILRMSLTALFRSVGLDCDVAADGETAVAMMRAVLDDPAHEGYAFVLMDNEMGPGINGPEAIRQIVEFDTYVTPIYGLTGHVLASDQKCFVDAGAVRHEETKRQHFFDNVIRRMIQRSCTTE